MKMMKHGHLSRCKHVQINEKYLDNNLADNGGKTDFLLDLPRQLLDEPRREKTGLRGFRPGPT